MPAPPSAPPSTSPSAPPLTSPRGKRVSHRTGATNERRQHAAATAAASAAASASPTTAPKTRTKSATKAQAATPPKRKPKTPATQDSATTTTTTTNVGNASPTTAVPNNDADVDDDDDEGDQGRQQTAVEERLVTIEGKVKSLEEEGERAREEVLMLRDRLEESEWSKNTLEEKTKQMEEEIASLKAEIEREKEGARKKIKDVEQGVKRLAEIDNNGGGERQQQQQQPRQQQQWQQQLQQQQPPQQQPPLQQHQQQQPPQHRPQQPPQQQRRRRCIILTDSNGKGATSDSIKNHIPRDERDSYDIEVVVAYTLEAAFHRVDRGAIDIRGAVVIVDNLTNDIRGTSVRSPLSPRAVTHWVDKLCGRLRMAGAAAVVVCQVKPMQVADVTPYNDLLSEYLCTQDQGFGCKTQIRLTYLKPDGFHVRPQFDSVIDRTYACAIRGVPVSDPTPFNEFLPDHLRRRWQTQWPRIGGGGGRVVNNGW